MPRHDWTPAVLATAVLSVVVAAVVWFFVVLPGGRGGAVAPDTPDAFERPAEVVVWAGELAPDLKGVLSPVWGEPAPDDEHDARLNAGLDLKDGLSLRWFRLLLFNLGAEARTVTLAEGALEIHAPDHTARLVDLGALVARGDARLTPALEMVLRTQGGMRSALEVPPGEAASLVLPFADGVALAEAAEVVTADGRALRRRPLPRAEYRRLIEAPHEGALRDL
jgi:hypothetical protein